MQGKNSEDILRHNRAMILEYIRKHPYTSRTELAEKSALTQTTISNIVSELISFGIVEETGTLSGKGGRKPIGLQIAPENHLIICFHIEAERLHCALFELAGHNVQHQQISYENPSDAPEKIIAWVKARQEQYPDRKFLGVGVARTASLLEEDAASRRMQMDAVAERLRREVNLPIQVFTDTAASAYAHWMDLMESAKDRCIVYINTGESITSAVVAQGHVLPPAPADAGELGHVSINFNGLVCQCGARGCLNLYASLHAVRKDMEQKRELFPQSPVRADSSSRTIAAHYHKGDELTVSTVDTAAQYLGVAISGLLNLLMPAVVVIGGELVACGNGYLTAARQIMSKYAAPTALQHTRIMLEKQGLNSALTGMYHLAVHAAVQNIHLFT